MRMLANTGQKPEAEVCEAEAGEAVAVAGESVSAARRDAAAAAQNVYERNASVHALAACYMCSGMRATGHVPH